MAEEETKKTLGDSSSEKDDTTDSTSPKEENPELNPDSLSDGSEIDLDSEKYKPTESPKKQRFAFLKKKKVFIPIIIVLVVGLALLVPLTRYSIFGLFVKEDLPIVVLDSQTNQPVTDATITASNVSATTDNHGKATLKIKPGSTTVVITKKYYNSVSKEILVPLFQPKTQNINLVASGRLVPISVIDKISNTGISNALVTSSGTQVQTDDNGKAILVLPADVTQVNGTISAKGYNNSNVSVTITTQTTVNNAFKLIPSGSIYFLSNQSGKIDVVKTNLDGTNRSTVLAGTGSEDQYNTVLMPSHDWKYLALVSRRVSGGNQSLYIIDTSNDSLYTADNGNATFVLNGWSGDRLIYTVARLGVSAWQPNAQALKTYNAQSKQIGIIDQTQGSGTSSLDYQNTSISGVYVLNNLVVYTQQWASPSSLAGKSDSFYQVNPDGSDKKDVKDFPVPTNSQYGFFLYMIVGKPNQIYIQASNDPNGYYVYLNGSITQNTSIQSAFSAQAINYFLSPSNSQYFWTQNRDGQSQLSVSDASGNNSKTIGTIDQKFSAYGWFTDKYFLVSNSSEIDILPVSGIANQGQMTKISNYYSQNGQNY